MYMAIRAGETDRVVDLLQRGTDVNQKDRRGGATPLMHAAAVGNLATLRVLIDKGADVNARSANGATALMWAVNDLDKVRLLVERGADVNAVSENGRSALLLAAMADQSDAIVRLLLGRGAKTDVVDKDRTSVLLAATIGNDAGTVRQILDAGVDVNAADALIATTPLMFAVQQGNPAIVNELIARGAQVNAISREPSQPVKNGTIALGRLTPLMLAAPYGPLGIVQALLKAGATVNVADARGLTPLMLAIATDHGDPQIVRALLSAGADVTAKSNDGETALDWALKFGTTPEVALLKRAGASQGGGKSQPTGQAAPTETRAAVERAVSLIERTSGSFFANGGCGACHAQMIADIAVSTARKHGARIDGQALAMRSGQAAGLFTAISSNLLLREDGPAVDILLYSLAAAASAGQSPDRGTDALAFNVAAQQMADGRWHIGGIARPPIEDGDFTRTALGVRGLSAFGPPARADMPQRVARATEWLRNARPVTTEDRAFRLLGLSWGGAPQPQIQAAARELVSQQRRDGGWSQRHELASDAYATGMVIFALTETGAVARTDAAVQRGVAYLRSTQRADGSWYVRSRSPKFQPYFESGFPHGHDQWISAMATGWATAALSTGLSSAPAATAQQH
jgi:ankyrin repeat protein